VFLKKKWVSNGFLGAMGVHPPPVKTRFFGLLRHVWARKWVYPFSLLNKLTRLPQFRWVSSMGFSINPDMKPREIWVNGLNFVSIYHQAWTDIDMDSEDSAYEVDGGVDVDDDTPMVEARNHQMRKFDVVIDDIEQLMDVSTKSREHNNMLKRNFWHLLCSRVGISVTEEDKLMKEEDMWLVCHERFLSSKETLPIASTVEFIFSL
jgi:hypothetical protein